MCPRCRNTGSIIIKFPGVTKQCNCGCSDGGNNPPDGNKYMIFPFGGTDGDVLVKQGEKVIFKKIAEIIGVNQQTALIEIESDGQTVFTDVIPEGKLLLQVFMDGLLQTEGEDYEVPENSRTINWISTLIPLKTIYQFKIIYI